MEEGAVDKKGSVPADDQAAEVAQPGKGALDDPAPAVASQLATVPRLDARYTRHARKGRQSPRLEPKRFLLHPDPEVRESARNGMIVLGDAQAGPLLREASRHVTDPREAAVLLEAADYVELPSATPRLRKRSPVQPR